MRFFDSAFLVLLAGTCLASQAQSNMSLSGCDAPPEVHIAFASTLSQASLAKLKTNDRDKLRRHVIEGLLVKYPREYSLYEQQMYTVQSSQSEKAKAEFDALRDRWIKLAKENPDDSLWLLLAGKALEDKDTREALRLIESAKSKAPDFPWPAHELATLYWRGKYSDTAKMKENLEKFYSLCPAWTTDDFLESHLLQQDLPLVAKTTTALRARVEKETEPAKLKDYQILWQREFLVRPPSEHDAVRTQIRQDLKRLETLVPDGDAEWRGFLINGYRLSGASKEELAKMQDDAARDFPHSVLALSKRWEQWNKDHPRPSDPKDSTAWKAYYDADIEMIKKLIREFPDDPSTQRSAFFGEAREDEFITQEDGLAAVDQYLKAMEDYGGYGTLSFLPSEPPRFLLDHGWESKRALELLKRTSTYKDGGHTKTKWGDNIPEEDLKRFKGYAAAEDLSVLGLILQAATLAGEPEEALQFRSAIEEPPPSDKSTLEQYWTNRARLASLDKHPQDALVYYRLALENRTKAPEYHHGLLRDDLTAEFHKLWTSQGGTETAWLAWNPPLSTERPEIKTEATAAGKNVLPTNTNTLAKKEKGQETQWKTITAKMPSFQLSDFSGKAWKQKDLQGKVVVVVSWATWCAPCRLQDKLLQSFYDKVKDRKDLVIVSFNVDENPGLVLPFMQKQEYTFPVLAAFSYEEAKGLVPRTWIIDALGNWRWVKDGYDESKTYAEFEKDMLAQVEKAKVGQ